MDVIVDVDGGGGWIRLLELGGREAGREGRGVRSEVGWRVE